MPNSLAGSQQGEASERPGAKFELVGSLTSSQSVTNGSHMV